VRCGPSVLLTSKNLVLPVRLVACGPPVGLSSSVKNSVNTAFLEAEHQISDLVLKAPRRTGRTTLPP
jgi:hypothetical protein